MIGLPLRETRQRCDQQTFHASDDQSRCVIDQLVGLVDPNSLAAALEPVVEDDGGGLAAFADAGAVTDHEATPKAYDVRRIFTRGADDIEGGIHRP